MSKFETSNPISLPLYVFHNAKLSLELQREEVEIAGKGASPTPIYTQQFWPLTSQERKKSFTY